MSEPGWKSKRDGITQDGNVEWMCVGKMDIPSVSPEIIELQLRARAVPSGEILYITPDEYMMDLRPYIGNEGQKMTLFGHRFEIRNKEVS
jgi:hypothetical protein